MFKSESWQSHDEYRTIVDTYGHRLSRNNPRYHFDLYYKEQQKLLSLNLDTVRDYIAGYYSNTGRPAKNQAQILRQCHLVKALAGALLVGQRYLNSYLCPFFVFECYKPSRL